MRRPVSLPSNPHWYKEAIIYQLRVRSFADSNDDGVGDLKGLTRRLGYLQDLGVTAVWLMPFYPSPGKDDGYDIADYLDVDPEVGTIDDFKEFLDEAHRRGLRVITELVINHTSDAHPWFQRARRAQKGSVYRDFYVWSDTPNRYRQARIIFRDFEHSNWAWDPIACQYFWHRFYSHQPDLNFDNPAVHDAVFGVMDFWLGMGVDGLRLDAVPYLYEREGTSCENLPETHAFLKKLRAHVDENYADRMLLAEANQWPEDAAAYFGDGDECHMNFHFPMMPRIFMAIHQEDRFPIVDIQAQTPEIPETAQWAVFLRNHDELTLEMVTDEERDYMYGAYANDPTARINLGIRRRLAPLVGNNRRVIELMNALLFSLPGTPVLYYGDEIGMGDNIYLGDRNGVRTPMQWSADRNAGFSRCNPQRLILPVIIDPEYHYESVNVEAQQNNPNSLLWWMKRLIALRRRFRAFGWGTVEFLSPENPRVLSFLRKVDDELILVVTNLSRFVQYVELDLAHLAGMFPVELFGRTEFPAIGELPYLLTLSGHGIYWFQLKWPREAALDARALAYQPPSLHVSDDWTRALEGDERATLEHALQGWLLGRRWFTEPKQRIHRVFIEQMIRMPGIEAVIAIVQVQFTDHEPDRYLFLLSYAAENEVAEIQSRSPTAILAHVYVDEEYGVLFDALSEAPSCTILLRAVLDRVQLQRGDAVLWGSRADDLPDLSDSDLEPHIVRAEFGNVSINFGDRLFLKVYRRQGDGINPELEIGRALKDAPVPRLLGALEMRTRREEPRTLATLFEYVQHEGDARAHARAELGRFFDRVLTEARDRPPPEAPSASVVRLATMSPPPLVAELVGVYLETARRLGARTADLHLAIAGPSEDPAFSPISFSPMDQRSSYQTVRNVTGKVLRKLRLSLPNLSPETQETAQSVLDRSEQLYLLLRPLIEKRLTAQRARHHGSLDLSKFLFTGKDFVIIDLEGDKSRAMAERRRKRSPLRDVAGVLRSFWRLATTVLLDPGLVRESDRPMAAPWAEAWRTWVGAAFLGSYLDTAWDARFIPENRNELSMLLDVFLIEHTLHELGSILDENPARADVPLTALVTLIDAGREAQHV